MPWTRKRQFIRQTAESLLQLGAVEQPPVPVEDLARLCGAVVRYEPFAGELSGLLSQEHGRIVIGVNAEHAPTRQRFTIAHELGHLKLHRENALYVDRNFRVLMRDDRSSQAVDPEEVEANAFAAELLMPTGMLIQDLGGNPVDYDDDAMLSQLAQRYKVSLQAMIFRLTNIGLLDHLGEPDGFR
jgi:Zn-dependent peptidase ImmA (M78 family)